MQESLKRSERFLATVSERSQLLARISDIAGNAQLSIDSLTPRTEAEGGYVRLRMDLDGRADFFPLIKFLRAVEKIGPEIKIKDISISWKPSVQEDKDPLQVRIMFETLLMQRALKKNA